MAGVLDDGQAGVQEASKLRHDDLPWRPFEDHATSGAERAEGPMVTGSRTPSAADHAGSCQPVAQRLAELADSP